MSLNHLAQGTRGGIPMSRHYSALIAEDDWTTPKIRSAHESDSSQ
jgi:hypothetical protein